ncbi:hypothetical protein [Deinococcus hopiensis]|uniref:Uncharacterized protein n=1 Tax=Deinococcus hopiensis KR-140 TaxID=695939 RepID=A0A1W1U9W6_9DEIO|nr:hypothetical protein [Deinococcus hopiensis]SMB77875.1 hypothetical protein SAMN00790413_03979 [Deinococcus hopiensis KR-140]
MDTEKLESLLKDIDRHGAMLEFEARSVHSEDLVDIAIARNFIRIMETEIGKIAYLAHKGRIMVGHSSGYIPSEESLINAVFLRQVEKDLTKKGYETSVNERRNSVVYYENGKKVLVLAKQDGYTRVGIRRLYAKEVLSNEFSEMHVYCYDADKIEMIRLRDAFYEPEPGRKKLALDPEKFKLFNFSPKAFTQES